MAIDKNEKKSMNKYYFSSVKQKEQVHSRLSRRAASSEFELLSWCFSW